MSVKTFAVFAIVVGCFAVLYPKFLNPMFSRLLGYHEPKQEIKQPQYPPGYHKAMAGNPEAGRPNIPDDMRQHMRAGPHPGLRAAADMGRHQTQHGSGRGMMGIVLPMYAVGIVLYLIYTLVKVFNKKDQSPDRGHYGYRSRVSENIYDNREGKFTFGDDLSNPESVRGFMQSKQKHQELEDLLVRSDDQNITANEMRELQRRLEETEAQMSKILLAMKNVSTKVDEVVSDQTTDETVPTETNKTEESADNKDVKTSDSSPDMEGYEIIKKSEKGSPIVESTSEDGITSETTSKTEESSCPEHETKNESNVNNCPETIQPEETQKSNESNKRYEKASDDDKFVDVEEKQDVLIQEKVSEDEEAAGSVRHRNPPTVLQE